jgi:hypothetical protein
MPSRKIQPLVFFNIRHIFSPCHSSLEKIRLSSLIFAVLGLSGASKRFPETAFGEMLKKTGSEFFWTGSELHDSHHSQFFNIQIQLGHLPEHASG